MKILLQNTRNKLYFCLMDVWVSNPHAAFDFRHSARAVEYAQKHCLKDVHLVVKFEDPQWDEVVPLPLLVGSLSPALAA